MIKFEKTGNYYKTISHIKTIRRVIVGLATFLLIALFVLSIPLRIQNENGKTLDYKGIPIAASSIFAVAIVAGAIALYSLVSIPLATALSVECDPQKHLELHIALDNAKKIDVPCMEGYFYLGDFEKSLECAKKVVDSNKERKLLYGLFNKARAEFFIGDMEAFNATISRYKAVLHNTANIVDKSSFIHARMEDSLEMLEAIANNDKEYISKNYKALKDWNTSKADEGFVNYIKGRAARIAGDTDEAIYRLMAVKDKCDKTVLCILAQEQFDILKSI